MLGQTILALGLTLVSACLINWGYITEHAAATRLPPLSAREPLRSLRLLLGSRRWRIGFGAETVGFGLYVVAVAPGGRRGRDRCPGVPRRADDRYSSG